MKVFKYSYILFLSLFILSNLQANNSIFRLLSKQLASKQVVYETGSSENPDTDFYSFEVNEDFDEDTNLGHSSNFCTYAFQNFNSPQILEPRAYLYYKLNNPLPSYKIYSFLNNFRL